MQRFVVAGLLLLALIAAAAGNPVRITLLHVNDVYQMTPVDKRMRGALARIATLRDRVQAGSRHTLLILGGDTISPSVASKPFNGAQMIAAWNALRLDLAVLGNHEFDFGPEVLQARMRESRFPWLAANVIDRATGRPFGGARASELRIIEGVKIGFLGVLTDETTRTSMPGRGIRFDDPVAAARGDPASASPTTPAAPQAGAW